MAEDVKESVIQKTQKTLGKYITKPTLTPKLLKKPPFRFLHDIVTSVIRENGFLKGLYTDEEMISENVKERDAKIAFLSKLIAAINGISGNVVDVKPAKIVAGLEPTKTNKLLQAIGNCLEKKLDSTEYVSKLTSSESIKKSKKPSVEKESKGSKTSKDSSGAGSTRKSDKISKSSKKPGDLKTKSSIEKSSKTTTDSTRKEVKNKESKIKEKEKTKKTDKIKPNVIKDETPENLKEAIQEKEAHLKIEENTKEVEILEEPKESTHENSLVIAESGDVKPETLPVPREVSAKDRPKSAKIHPGNNQNVKLEQKDALAERTNFLRPPSARPTSARPGAPRLRPESALPPDQVVTLGTIKVIVEDHDQDEEEETVIVQNAEIPRDKPPVEDLFNLPQDKGHLVEQILEQINEVDDFKSKNEEENFLEDARSKDASRKEIRQIQGLVQTLTRVANPLGKLMTYLHEDLDGMYGELTMWANMKKQAYGEIKKQKELQRASGEVLEVRLREVEDSIKKIEAEIACAQANVLRNDIRIKQLLTR